MDTKFGKEVVHERITAAYSAMRSETVGDVDYLDIPISLSDYEDILDRARQTFTEDYQRFVETILIRANAQQVQAHNDALTRSFSLGMYEPDVDLLNAKMYRKTAAGQPDSWWSMFDKKLYIEAA